MNRTEAREQAFKLVFEYGFRGGDAEELFDDALLADEIEDDEFSKSELCGVVNNLQKIDEVIEPNLKSGWSCKRLPKVSLAILRLAVYEILFDDTIPVSVTINEAVELARKYGSEEDTAYINGVLGSVARKA